MSAYRQSFYIKSISFTTDDATPVTHDWSCSDGGAPANERVADNSFPTNQTILDPTATATIDLADVMPSSLPDLGDRGTLVMTLVEQIDDATPDVITMYRMVYAGISASQSRATAGGSQLEFAYESDCSGKNCLTS